MLFIAGSIPIFFLELFYKLQVGTMGIGYVLKEGFVGMKRAKLASLVTIVIIGIALSLFNFFLISSFNITRIITHIKSRVELEAFIEKSLGPVDERTLEEEISGFEGVANVIYVSKSEAAQLLKESLGAHDLFDLLKANPLPASFKVRLKKEYRDFRHVKKIAEQIENIVGVDEVSYQKELLELLDEKIDLLKQINAGLGVLIAIASIFLVSNTIKLTIYAKKDIIKTMKLVGAANGLIAGPFLIEGMLQGILGSAIAVVISHFAVEATNRYLATSVIVPFEIYAVVVLGGALLGLFGSFLSIRFFLREKIQNR